MAAMGLLMGSHVFVNRFVAAFVLVASVIWLAPAPVAGQEPRDDKAKTSGTSLVTLLGCVAAPAGKQKAFTLSEIQGGDIYALQGLDVKEFVGKRVEVAGSRASRRFVIRGGLYPNANVAAQAGDMDPTKAAMAAQAGPEANTPRPAPEFRVRSVRAIGGDCPDPAK